MQSIVLDSSKRKEICKKTRHKSRSQSELPYFSDHSSSKIKVRTLSTQLLEESQQFKDKFGDAKVNIKKKKRVNRRRTDSKKSGYFRLEKNPSNDIISLSQLEEELEVAKEVFRKI